MEPQYRFCTSADGTRIAYMTYGSGPPLLYARVFWWGMESQFAMAQAREYFDALAARTTLVTFDRRGCGLSAREVQDLSVVAEAADIAAVAGAAGFGEFTLFGEASAAASCLAFAAAHAEHLARLVLWGPSSSVNLDAAISFRENWSYGRRVMAGHFFPDGPVWMQRAFSAAVKANMTAEMAARKLEALGDVELAALLPGVITRTVVLGSEHDTPRSRRLLTLMSGGLPNGETRFLNGVPAGHVTFVGHSAIVRAVLDAMALGSDVSSGTAVILFTDIADSTALTERLGDVRFREASRALDGRLRAAIREAGGAPVEGKVLGDGVMGVFTSATQAIDAARRCVAASAESELRLHIGLHAGDVIREDDNVYGGAVNIASRICGLCAPGEILVSATVRELARTSAGVTFEDRGEQMLKGIEDPVRVFAVVPASQ